MRLINTSSLQLSHVIDSTEKVYAILSHTWGSEEVTLQEVDQPASWMKAGFDKIKKTCSLARQKGFKWAWIDTCCIDKTSSAELSEAINSMFTWYHDSQVCFVYLEDLQPDTFRMKDQDRKSFLDERLPGCRWFTRGWTLQELIASPNAEFYDQEWNFVGTKCDLKYILSSITSIDSSILRDSCGLRDVPVARRMSWASQRQTTRKEDIAYCLLGIFDINMPLLYGEGEKAFLRLQDAIAAGTNDLSLFAWQSEGDLEDEVEQESGDTELELGYEGYEPFISRFGGAFASTPMDFRFCTTIKQHKTSTGHGCTVTGDIVTLKADLIEIHPVLTPSFFNYYLLHLGCVETSERTNGKAQWLSIYVTKFGPDFIRVVPDKISSHPSRLRFGDLYDESGTKSFCETVQIKKRLLPGEHLRMETFLGSTITFECEKKIPRHIKLLNLEGYPTSLFEGSGLSGPLDFAFRNPGYEGLEAMVTFQLRVELDDTKHTGNSTASKMMYCVIYCGLEWKADHVEPWAAIFTDNDDSDVAKDIIHHSSALKERDGINHVRAIHDIMLREYSDISGNMVQEMMPRSVMLPGAWKLSLVNERASSASDSDWKQNKSHIVCIEFHKAAQ